MADCNKLFLKFNDEITLNSDKKSSLRTSRNAIREDIKKYFKDSLGFSQPKFWGQGSYMMKTLIKPIQGEYDIDDGIYLEHLSQTAEKEWPSTKTVHDWIVNAVKDRTTTDPQNKNTCVRVIYKNDYHIDLPIYIKCADDDHPKLAHTSKGWISSDPKILTNWFSEQVDENGEQLRRIVKYFKAWKGYNEEKLRFPSGMIFTILVAEYFVEGYSENEDAAFIAIARRIHENLMTNFSLDRPVFPNEELLEDWSEDDKNTFLDELLALITTGQKALESNKGDVASKLWSEIFGDRFPRVTSTSEEHMSKGSALKTNRPAILGNYGRSS